MHLVRRQVRLRLYEDGKARVGGSTAGARHQVCASLLPQFNDHCQFMRYAAPTIRSLSMLSFPETRHEPDEIHGAWPDGNCVMEDWDFSMLAYHITSRTQWYLSREPPIRAQEFVMQTPKPAQSLSATCTRKLIRNAQGQAAA